jgi:y4mF family transcriptional regulator
MQLMTPKDLGAFIRDQRHQQEMSQQTLADKIGVSRLWVSEVENGKNRAEIGLILRALSALGISLSASDSKPAKKAGSVSDIDIDRIISAAKGKADGD